MLHLSARVGMVPPAEPMGESEDTITDTITFLVVDRLVLRWKRRNRRRGCGFM